MARIKFSEPSRRIGPRRSSTRSTFSDDGTCITVNTDQLRELQTPGGDESARVPGHSYSEWSAQPAAGVLEASHWTTEPTQLPSTATAHQHSASSSTGSRNQTDTSRSPVGQFYGDSLTRTLSMVSPGQSPQGLNFEPFYEEPDQINDGSASQNQSHWPEPTTTVQRDLRDIEVSNALAKQISIKINETLGAAQLCIGGYERLQGSIGNNARLAVSRWKPRMTEASWQVFTRCPSFHVEVSWVESDSGNPCAPIGLYVDIEAGAAAGFTRYSQVRERGLWVGEAQVLSMG